MRKTTIIWILFVLTLPCACSQSGPDSNKSMPRTKSAKADFSIVNWNVQTFFDANKDGCEYSDFQKKGSWDNQKYSQRLERLCQAISKLDADIYVFEEIENEAVIYDISNQLSANGHNWNQRKFWNYSAFAKEKGTAIGIGILSRYPLTNLKTHAMDINIHTNSQPSVRYILEATVSIENMSLIIFANHWKSKSGGQAKSEIWRDWQENLLGKRLAELKKENNGKMPPVVICGDFNRDALEFSCCFETQNTTDEITENTILKYADFGSTASIGVKSLWFLENGDFVSDKGSYYYKDSWERIDNIFITGGLDSKSFTSAADSPWASAQGIPSGYKIYSGEGWSDHLPVAAQLFFTYEE